MNGDRFFMRLRAALDAWFVPIVLVLLAVSLFSGYAVLSAFAEPTAADHEQETVEVWAATGGFDHAAEVQTENEVFDVGDRLAGEGIYYSRIAPELEGEFVHRYDADSGSVDVHVDLEREIRSVDDDGQAYWSTSEPLNGTAETDVEPGDGQTAEFVIDVPQLDNESDRISSSLGDTPGTIETVVVADVTMDGTIEGESVQWSERYELAIEPDGDSYAVDGPVSDRYAAERTEPVDDAATAGISIPTWPVALLVVSLGALGTLVVRKSQDRLAPSRTDLERLAVERERASLDEWITTGRLPDDVRGRSRVSVESLEGLVDVAIDCDRRVIEESDDEGTYYVVDGDVLYVYEQEELPDLATDSTDDLSFEADGTDDGEELDDGSERIGGDDESADDEVGGSESSDDDSGGPDSWDSQTDE